MNALIPPELLPLSVAGAEAQQDPALRRLLLIMLQQFSVAYGLPVDPGFASAFDTFFSTNLGNAAALVAVPRGLQDGIDDYADWQPAYNGLVTMIGFAQWVSAQIEAHLADRAAFYVQQRQLMSGLQAVAGIFFREEWEVELGVTQAFAAQLQADYTRYPHPEISEPTVVLTARLFATIPMPAARPLSRWFSPRFGRSISASTPIRWICMPIRKRVCCGCFGNGGSAGAVDLRAAGFRFGGCRAAGGLAAAFVYLGVAGSGPARSGQILSALYGTDRRIWPSPDLAGDYAGADGDPHARQ